MAWFDNKFRSLIRRVGHRFADRLEILAGTGDGVARREQHADGKNRDTLCHERVLIR